jgi:hypothetical protein
VTAATPPSRSAGGALKAAGGVRFVLAEPDGRGEHGVWAHEPADDPDSSRDRSVSSMYLPGARMRALDSSDVGELLDPFRWWVPCLGGVDGLLAPNGDDTAGRVPPGVFEEFVSQFGSPFAWLVVATPVPPGDLKKKIRNIDRAFRGLLLAENLDEATRIRLVRQRAWRREYTRAGVHGLWDVRILVGSTTGSAAAAAAAVLCGSSALDGLPYRLVPDRPLPGLGTALAVRRLARDAVDAVDVAEHGRPGARYRETEDDEDGGADTAATRFPFVAGTDLMAALVRPPSRELPGIRLEAPNTFDVTPEHQATRRVTRHRRSREHHRRETGAPRRGWDPPR